MSKPIESKRRIIFITFPDLALIDLAGPASVFNTANVLQEHQIYEVLTTSMQGGLTNTDMGAPLQTHPLTEIQVTNNDTLLVVGAEWPPIKAAMTDAALTSWLTQNVSAAERYGSVCLGSFILGSAGLLDHHRATTHWAACHRLTKKCPKAKIDPNALYVCDNRLWTSAGVTTGIDMALAMVEQDHGRTLMGRIAKRLVVYSRRPGNQSQFSSLLEAQVTAGDEFSDLPAFMEANLHQPLKVDQLAREAGMSERNFYRRFTAKFGLTPSRYLEQLRLERAKQLLENQTPVKAVAAAVGFRSEAGFRSAFQSGFGISPSVHQKLHGRG